MKEVRIMRGLTQENLGEKVHLSTNYIGLIERNVDTPSLSAIIDIANELGVSLDYLVGTHIKKKKNYQECRKYENQIIEIDEALESRELIKVKILESCQQDKNEIAQELSLKTDAEVVQILGRTIILYRESEKEIYRLP